MHVLYAVSRRRTAYEAARRSVDIYYSSSCRLAPSLSRAQLNSPQLLSISLGCYHYGRSLASMARTSHRHAHWWQCRNSSGSPRYAPSCSSRSACTEKKVTYANQTTSGAPLSTSARASPTVSVPTATIASSTVHVPNGTTTSSEASTTATDTCCYIFNDSVGINTWYTNTANVTVATAVTYWLKVSPRSRLRHTGLTS